MQLQHIYTNKPTLILFLSEECCNWKIDSSDLCTYNLSNSRTFLCVKNRVKIRPAPTYYSRAQVSRSYVIVLVFKINSHVSTGQPSGDSL